MPKKTLFAAATLLLLSSLKARAAYIDLTTAGSSSYGDAAIGGANSFFVQQISPQSTGTGVIDPFVRIQKTGAEQGYNTSLGAPLDDKKPVDQYTRALLLSDVPIVTLSDGHPYRQFLLDVNEDTGGSDELLSLNQIQIFRSTIDRTDDNNPNPTAGSSPLIAFGSPTPTEIFRFNDSTDVREILLDYSLNSGSGSGDMFLYVRNEQFSLGSGDYVILYSQFGDPPGGRSSSDGFEEWSVLQGNTTQAVPAPPAFLLMGLGAGIMGFVARRRREVVAA